MAISSSSRTYLLNGHLFFSCPSKFGGLCGQVTDNNTAADLHGSYPQVSMNFGEFFGKLDERLLISEV